MIANKSSSVIDNFDIYVTLPVSFNRNNYKIEITDSGKGCISYGASIVNNNKFKLFNIWFKNEDIGGFNTITCAGYVLTLGF